MRTLRSMAALLPVFFMCTFTQAQDDDYAPPPAGPLIIDGKVTDGENKLPGTEVTLYKGNEKVSTQKTDKGGKFHVELDLQENYSIAFEGEGFVVKRIAVDTHMPKPKKDHFFELAPIVMDVSLLERKRYDGANTDDLDFPFAMVKFDKTQMAFAQDIEYTMGMQRVNGALLLMAARTDMKK